MFAYSCEIGNGYSASLGIWPGIGFKGYALELMRNLAWQKGLFLCQIDMEVSGAKQ
jgi:hypothetical protein